MILKRRWVGHQEKTSGPAAEEATRGGRRGTAIENVLSKIALIDDLMKIPVAEGTEIEAVRRTKDAGRGPARPVRKRAWVRRGERDLRRGPLEIKSTGAGMSRSIRDALIGARDTHHRAKTTLTRLKR